MTRRIEFPPRRKLVDLERDADTPNRVADACVRWVEAVSRILLALAGLALLIITIIIVLEAKWNGRPPGSFQPPPQQHNEPASVPPRVVTVTTVRPPF